MTDAIDIKDLFVTMDELLAKGKAARRKVQDATEEYRIVRAEVSQYKRKYGRVLEMMKEDE